VREMSILCQDLNLSSSQLNSRIRRRISEYEIASRVIELPRTDDALKQLGTWEAKRTPVRQSESEHCLVLADLFPPVQIIERSL